MCYSIAEKTFVDSAPEVSSVKAKRRARSDYGRRWSSYLRIVFLLAGIIVIYFLGKEVGWGHLWQRLRESLFWFPLVFGLELVRAGLDALTSYYAYGKKAKCIPVKVLVRAQLIGSAAGSILPASRTSEEATKAALLAPWAGGPESAAAAATNQAAALVATGFVSIPCTVLSWYLTRFSIMTLALLIHTLIAVALGAGLRWGMRSPALLNWVTRHFGHFSHMARDFRATAEQAGGIIPIKPVLMQTLSRLVQVIQFGLLAHAVGVELSFVNSFFLQGINLITIALGAFVPAQVGISEGIYLFSAKYLGIHGPQAMAISLLTHAMQIAMILLGTAMLFAGKHRKSQRA